MYKSFSFYYDYKIVEWFSLSESGLNNKDVFIKLEQAGTCLQSNLAHIKGMKHTKING